MTLGGGGLPKLAVVTLRAFRRQMWVDGNRDIDGDADVDLDGVGDGDGDPVKVQRKTVVVVGVAVLYLEITNGWVVVVVWKCGGLRKW